MSSLRCESCCAPFCGLPCFRKSKNACNVAEAPLPVAIEVEEQPINNEKAEVEAMGEEKKEVVVVKSSLKKSKSKKTDRDAAAVKQNVSWMDMLGKELTEVKEFEPSESGDSQDEASTNSACACVIQ